jgi:hypothetical protein
VRIRVRGGIKAVLKPKQDQETKAAASNVPEVMKLVSPDEIGVNPTVCGSISTNRYIALVCAEMEKNILKSLIRLLTPNEFMRCAEAILVSDVRVRSDEERDTYWPPHIRSDSPLYR